MNAADARRNGRPSDESPLQHLLGVLRRNKLLAIGVPIVVLVATAVFVMLATPVYEATVTVRIDEERSNVALIDMLSALSTGSEVNTEMEVLGSRVVAEGVVDSLDLQLRLQKPRRVPRSAIFATLEVSDGARPGEYRLGRVEDGQFAVTAEYPVQGERNPLWPFPRKEEEAFGTIAVGQRVEHGGVVFRLAAAAAEQDEIRFEVVPIQEAVKDLRAELDVNRPNREANIVVVRYEHYDPELVQAVSNQMAQQFIRRRQEVQRSEAVSTVAFLDEQIDTLASQLNAAETTLKDFREQNQLVAPEAEASAQVERLADMQGQRDMLESERSALADLLEDVRTTQRAPGEPSPYRRLMAFPTLLRNPASSELLRILAEVENERAELLSRRTPADEDVRVLTQRIEELEDQLHQIATTYLEGLTSQRRALDTRLAAFEDELNQVPAKEITLARLTRETSVLSDIFTMLQTRRKEAEIAAAVEDASVRVVDPAILPMEPIKPRGMLSMALALLLGSLMGVGVAAAKEQLDTAIHTRDDIQQVTGLAVLGMIPSIREMVANGSRLRRVVGGARPASSDLRLVTSRDPRSPVAEAYRSLRTNITFSNLEHAPETIVFTSSMPGDGKSTTAVNLAVTLVQQGLDVVLIDADMRRGELHDVFGVEPEPGLSNLLLGRSVMGEVVRPIAVGDAGNLQFMPTGTLPPNPAELLGSARMRELLKDLAKTYDYVLLDAPPLNVVTDAAILGTSADGVLLVARAGVSEASGVNYAIDQLRHVEASILGVVLNDVDFKRQHYYGGRRAHDYYAGPPSRS